MNTSVNTAMLADMLECLSEENRFAVFSYVQYLMDMEGRRKAQQAQRAFENVDTILNGDTGWASEEEMIADLAEFRRKSMETHENTD